MEKPAFTRASLSDVRVIMVIMRVPVDELLCQAATRWIPILECLFVRSVWASVATSCHARH
jgi:hypothetical protein